LNQKRYKLNQGL